MAPEAIWINLWCTWTCRGHECPWVGAYAKTYKVQALCGLSSNRFRNLLGPKFLKNLAADGCSKDSVSEASGSLGASNKKIPSWLGDSLL